MKIKQTVIISSISILIVATLVLFSMFNNKEKESDSIELLCTTFPLYLITSNLTVGLEQYSVSALNSSQGGCAHNYILTPADKKELNLADLVVVNGYGLDDFAIRGLEESNKGLIIDSSKLIKDFISYSSSEEKLHSHGNSNVEHSVNAHYFVSPKLNSLMAEAIFNRLILFSPKDETLLRKNFLLYQTKNRKIETSLNQLNKGDNPIKVITQHAALNYLTKDAGIEVVAVLNLNEGGETSSYFLREMIKLIEKNSVDAIFIEPGRDHKIASLLSDETGIILLEIDPVSNGFDSTNLDYYQDKMNKNILLISELINKRQGQK